MIDLNDAEPQTLVVSPPQRPPTLSVVSGSIVDETQNFIASNETYLLGQLGIALPARGQHINCPLPAHDDLDPSWRWDATASRYFCTCGSGDMLDLVRQLGRAHDVVSACNWVREQLGCPLIGEQRQETTAERRERARHVAELQAKGEVLRLQREEDARREELESRAHARSVYESGQPAGAIVAAYLASRGITCPVPPSFRFLPAAGKYLPCMMVPFALFADGVAGVHLTLLQPDGSGKAQDGEGRSKKMLGRGHTLPLIVAPGGNPAVLFIAEGIEDALSAHQACGVMAWAAGAAGRLADLAEHVPATVKTVVIQQDDNEAGRRNAARLAEALAARKIEVRICEATGDTDVNSVLQAEGNAGVLAYVGKAKLWGEARQLDNTHYARREGQKVENTRIAEDDTKGGCVPIMDLGGMQQDLVWLAAGAYVGRISDKRVMKAQDFAHFFAASKTKKMSAKGDSFRLVPTFNLWREDHNRLWVDAQTWKPEASVFCSLPTPATNGGSKGFNTWADLPPYTAPEDWFERCAPFREHLEYLCPISAERAQFTMWLAHIFQRPGVLAHHFYCHITKTHGVGRNWLASALVRMLRRYVAPDLDMETVLESAYNDQMSKKLLLIFNEVYEPGGMARHKRGTKLRALVNPEFRHINPKCERAHVEYNFARWLCFSNFYEAIAFDTDDNRLVMIENPSQRQSDAYYTRLYTAYDDPAFIASCRHWLQTLDIRAFNPGRVTTVNEIKLRSLQTQQTQEDAALRWFRSLWSGEWTGATFLKKEIARYLREIEGMEKLDEANYRHALTRAGFGPGPQSKTFRFDGEINPQRLLTIEGGTTREALETITGGDARILFNQWVEGYEIKKGIAEDRS